MKKVLIITYYWPPSGGPGVQRWLKFVKYLPEFGFQPIVYVPENPHYPIQDTSLLDEVPSECIIHKQPIFEPYGFAKLLSPKKTKRISSGIIQTKKQSLLEKFLLWVRGNFFIPDARKFWVKPSVSYLSGLIEREHIETIITTGPPHSVHLIGLGLTKNHHLRWLADFRDPWTSIGYHKKLKLTKTSQKKHLQLESSVLNVADAIVTTSYTTLKEFQKLTDKPGFVITNGFDVESERGTTDLDKTFTISHIGSLLTGRNPKNLWKTLAELAGENEVFRTHLQLEFIGVVSKDVMDTIYRYELGPYVKLRGYVSHKQAIRRQCSSQVLLLVEIDSDDTKGIIPGKLFEYMAAKRPVLAFGPMGWEVGNIIQATGTGEVFDHVERNRLKSVLLKWFTAYKKGGLHMPMANIEEYSRMELTRKLAKLLKWE
ncbi:MAG: glycosyl transferase family 1 [Bacteroidota bacterium]